MNPPSDQHPSTQADQRPGEVIGGKYRLDALLGTGGMGVVFAATHLVLRERVALKFLLPVALVNPTFVARFMREARAAARIKSQHVARVIDVGSLDNGAPYIVMEHLTGLDLHKTISARGPLPVHEAALYIAQACAAVSEAHLYGIIHRDLKPANLFLAQKPDGSAIVKVLDFGISKVAGDDDANLTATCEVLGTPLYMSPEQIRDSHRVDARSDVWSLGAILYKLLAGRAAFAATSSHASLAKIVADAPPPLRQVRPDIPPELEAVVLRCLEKDAAHRMQSADELARALGPFLPNGPPTFSPVETGARAMDVPTDPNATLRLGRKVLIGVAAATATVVGAVLAITLFGGPAGDHSAVAATAPTAAASQASASAPAVSSAPAAPPPQPQPSADVVAPPALASAVVHAGPSGASPLAGPRKQIPGRGAPSKNALDDRL